MRPTPLTDSMFGGHQQQAAADLCRQLERDRAELIEALQRLDRAYQADYELVPTMDLKTSYETNSQAHTQARALLERLK